MPNAMIVEDSIPFRTLFKNELLSQFPSIEVIEAGSGEEAIKSLGSHPVDLAFMDIGLPGQNGLEVTKRMKADYPGTSIAILTSHDSPEYREAAIRCGASCFISKDSFKWKEIFTLVGCFQKAKLDGGLKPTCGRLESGEI